MGLWCSIPAVTFGEPVDAMVAARALGVAETEIDGPVLVCGAGRPKLMVPLRSLEALDGLAPEATAGGFATSSRSAGSWQEAVGLVIAAAQEPLLRDRLQGRTACAA